MVDEKTERKSGALSGGVFSQRGEGQGTILALIISGICLVSLGLTLVWLNTERTKTGYTARDLQSDLDSRTELNAKLIVEREYLLSQLGQKAKALGLRAALPGQIRKMELAQPVIMQTDD